MNAAKVVEHIMNRDSVFVVFELLRESIREPPAVATAALAVEIQTEPLPNFANYFASSIRISVISPSLAGARV